MKRNLRRKDMKCKRTWEGNEEDKGAEDIEADQSARVLVCRMYRLKNGQLKGCSVHLAEHRQQALLKHIDTGEWLCLMPPR
jgi:hypothetical protein